MQQRRNSPACRRCNRRATRCNRGATVLLVGGANSRACARCNATVLLVGGATEVQQGATEVQQSCLSEVQQTCNKVQQRRNSPACRRCNRRATVVLVPTLAAPHRNTAQTVKQSPSTVKNKALNLSTVRQRPLTLLDPYTLNSKP
jgi:hypothetical protein